GAEGQKSFQDDPANNPMTLLYLLTAFVFLILILTGFVAIYFIKVLNMLSTHAELRKVQQLGVNYISKPTLWQLFLQRVNASVPLEKEEEIELDHNYDGIKELDNHLPPWWTWLFIGTVVWAAIYIVIFHLSDTLPLQDQEYQNELIVANEQARKLRALQPREEVDENALTFSPDPATIEKGKVVFTNSNCGSCHRNDGGGNTIGPNLTDQYWLHGGDVMHIFHTVKNGVIEKGMPAWGKSMSPQNVKDVSFFIMSLQGTNPANPKAPQGELFKPTPNLNDSTKAEVSSL
ncbi:MAG TPA: cbb3-type cytochrome c oxidase N-terminal domain-containing protein, partial [Chryseolinea sp.]|nr:cbb3-type cytochrome c oxidase N-terminal domain-containing protein [Chryseolinea sp.]